MKENAKSIGSWLRDIRRKWGLTLSEVEERSQRLATLTEDSSISISGSWLARVERGKHDLTVPKLRSLATIYNLAPEDLVRLCQTDCSVIPLATSAFGPNSTLVLTNGPMGEQARALLPDDFVAQEPPEETVLLPGSEAFLTPYRRAIVGTRDRSLHPLYRAGSIFLIDTQRKTVAARNEWVGEHDRPIYLLFAHDGFYCAWCELDKTGVWLTLAPHAFSDAPIQRWRYRAEVEVVGRAIGVTMRLAA